MKRATGASRFNDVHAQIRKSVRRLEGPRQILQTRRRFVIIDFFLVAFPALLAQLAEQLTLNQRVVGSSPTGGIVHCPIENGNSLKRLFG